jgi:hypothetical protein
MISDGGRQTNPKLLRSSVKAVLPGKSSSTGVFAVWVVTAAGEGFSAEGVRVRPLNVPEMAAWSAAAAFQDGALFRRDNGQAWFVKPGQVAQPIRRFDLQIAESDVFRVGIPQDGGEPKAALLRSGPLCSGGELVPLDAGFRVRPLLVNTSDGGIPSSPCDLRWVQRSLVEYGLGKERETIPTIRRRASETIQGSRP